MEKTIRQQRSENTYRRFIEAIVDIIARGEVDSFTIRSLCGSLDLSPRTFYLYFESKEQAILKCYGYYSKVLVDEVMRRQDLTADYYDRVLQVFAAKIEVSLSALPMGRMLYICALNYYEPSLYDDELPFYKSVKAALDDCVEHGARAFTTDTRTIAWELIDFSRGIVFNYFLKNESSDLREESRRKMKRYLDTFVAR